MTLTMMIAQTRTFQAAAKRLDLLQFAQFAAEGGEMVLRRAYFHAAPGHLDQYSKATKVAKKV